MNISWLTASFSSLLLVFLSAIGIYLTLVIFTRFAGIRTFSKMTSFDIAVTIAIGSLVASTILFANITYLAGAIAIFTLFLLQVLFDTLKARFPLTTKFINNQPILLMKNGQVLEENLKEASLSMGELRHKLREANVTEISQVKAVVMETTGEVSVLHTENENKDFDEELLKDVRINID